MPDDWKEILLQNYSPSTTPSGSAIAINRLEERSTTSEKTLVPQPRKLTETPDENLVKLADFTTSKLSPHPITKKVGGDDHATSFVISKQIPASPHPHSHSLTSKLPRLAVTQPQASSTRSLRSNRHRSESLVMKYEWGTGRVRLQSHHATDDKYNLSAENCDATSFKPLRPQTSTSNLRDGNGMVSKEKSLTIRKPRSVSLSQSPNDSRRVSMVATEKSNKRKANELKTSNSTNHQHSKNFDRVAKKSSFLTKTHHESEKNLLSISKSGASKILNSDSPASEYHQTDESESDDVSVIVARRETPSLPPNHANNLQAPKWSDQVLT